MKSKDRAMGHGRPCAQRLGQPLTFRGALQTNDVAAARRDTRRRIHKSSVEDSDPMGQQCGLLNAACW
jgi:hypothetical protein